MLKLTCCYPLPAGTTYSFHHNTAVPALMLINPSTSRLSQTISSAEVTWCISCFHIISLCAKCLNPGHRHLFATQWAGSVSAPTDCYSLVVMYVIRQNTGYWSSLQMKTCVNNVLVITNSKLNSTYPQHSCLSGLPSGQAGETQW